MAVSMVSGVATTASPLSNDLKVDMSKAVAMLSPETEQFYTMMTNLPAEPARSFKVEWLEDRLRPRVTALAASAASDATNLTLTNGEGAYWVAGDILRNAVTREAYRVTATAASAVTVTRAVDGGTAASSASGVELVWVGNVNAQGATLPTRLITQKTTSYNYTGIFRTSYGFSETTIATEWYSGDQLLYERAKKLVEHKSLLEHAAFFGPRYYSATGPTHHPGGLLAYITTNISDAGGTFDKGELQDFLRTGLLYGYKGRKALFAAPIVTQVLGEFLQDNWIQTGTNETYFGAKVDGVISSAYGGARIPVFVKREWGAYSTASTQFGGYAFLVDLENVKRRPLRDTKLMPNRQANDADEVSEEYLTETSFEIKREETHSILRGVTG